ncbi:PqqD family protein [bacterium]|nr:PqqD family protein [bacterium]
MFQSETLLSRPKQMLAADLGGDTVLYHHAAGKYLKLDPVGARIWQLCADPISFQDLLAHLISEFEVEPELCSAQVTEFLLDLQRRRLLVVQNG